MSGRVSQDHVRLEEVIVQCVDDSGLGRSSAFAAVVPKALKSERQDRGYSCRTSFVRPVPIVPIDSAFAGTSFTLLKLA